MFSQFNSAAELSLIIIMAGLFLALLLKKNKKMHDKLFTAITAVDIFALISDLYMWLNVGDPQRVNFVKLFWGTNYLLVYAMIILFHFLLLVNIKSRTNISSVLYHIVIPLSVIGTVLYFYSYKSGMYFTIDSSGEIIWGELSWVSTLIRLSILLVDMLITLVYSTKLGPRSTFTLLLYETVPSVTLFFDARYGLCIFYVFTSVIILIDYIFIGVEQDLLIAKQKQHLAEQEKRITEEQTKIMISQMQPHFLYNVISSIMAFCKEDPDRAVSALADFSEYLRTNMRSLSLDTPVPFSKELEHVKTYIRLEKFRFGERLDMDYRLETEDFFIPTLTLQPIVENAVKHGIGQKPGGGTVTLKTEAADGGIKITVSDNGVGFDTEAAPGTEEYDKSDHIGISNVRSRLKVMCDGDLTIKSSPGNGTDAIVFLPYSGQLGGSEDRL